MNCKIEHRSSKEGVEYWCLSHKSLALSNGKDKPSICTCKYKDKYENIVPFNKEDIKSLKLVYNLENSVIPLVYINDELFDGILKLDNSIIDHKDYGGIMLSKLNNIKFEASSCPRCGNFHSDNGKFAYKPHSKHLCVYCGYFYQVEQANIGNEVSLYFDFPNISLEDKEIKITKDIDISYDMFSGVLKVNGELGNRLIINNEEVDLISYLNKKLENEY